MPLQKHKESCRDNILTQVGVTGKYARGLSSNGTVSGKKICGRINVAQSADANYLRKMPITLVGAIYNVPRASPCTFFRGNCDRSNAADRRMTTAMSYRNKKFIVSGRERRESLGGAQTFISFRIRSRGIGQEASFILKSFEIFQTRPRCTTRKIFCGGDASQNIKRHSRKS